MSHFETDLAHAGLVPDDATGALVPPIHTATTFERAADGSYPRGYVYSRERNPTRHLFETTLSDLEGGAACAAFASGMAASAAVFQALRPGDHVLFPDDVYYGVRRLLDSVFVPWGLAYSVVDMADLEEVTAALRPETRLVWIETPSNPMLKVTDVQAVAERAHAVDAMVLVDGTWMTPHLMRPLESNIDLVLHSVTKYLAGHSDVLGGALITRRDDAFWERLSTLHKGTGPVMDPFSAWLALRGMRTLAVRLQMQCASARRIAAFLHRHARVACVHHPSLPDHPGHAVARRQMRDFGGMLSFEIHGGREEALRVAARVKVFRRATSLGGTESLIEHRASIEAPLSRTPESLLRLSIGLEHPDDLLADLSHALGD